MGEHGETERSFLLVHAGLLDRPLVIEQDEKALEVETGRDGKQEEGQEKGTEEIKHQAEDGEEEGEDGTDTVAGTQEASDERIKEVSKVTVHKCAVTALISRLSQLGFSVIREEKIWMTKQKLARVIALDKYFGSLLGLTEGSAKLLLGAGDTGDETMDETYSHWVGKRCLLVEVEKENCLADLYGLTCQEIFTRDYVKRKKSTIAVEVALGAQEKEVQDVSVETNTEMAENTETKEVEANTSHEQEPSAPCAVDFHRYYLEFLPLEQLFRLGADSGALLCCGVPGLCKAQRKLLLQDHSFHKSSEAIVLALCQENVFLKEIFAGFHLCSVPFFTVEEIILPSLEKEDNMEAVIKNTLELVSPGDSEHLATSIHKLLEAGQMNQLVVSFVTGFEAPVLCSWLASGSDEILATLTPFADQAKGVIIRTSTPPTSMTCLTNLFPELKHEPACFVLHPCFPRSAVHLLQEVFLSHNILVLGRRPFSLATENMVKWFPRAKNHPIGGGKQALAILLQQYCFHARAPHVVFSIRDKLTRAGHKWSELEPMMYFSSTARQAEQDTRSVFRMSCSAGSDDMIIQDLQLLNNERFLGEMTAKLAKITYERLDDSTALQQIARSLLDEHRSCLMTHERLAADGEDEQDARLDHFQNAKAKGTFVSSCKEPVYDYLVLSIPQNEKVAEHLTLLGSKYHYTVFHVDDFVDTLREKSKHGNLGDQSGRNTGLLIKRRIYAELEKQGWRKFLLICSSNCTVDVVALERVLGATTLLLEVTDSTTPGPVEKFQEYHRQGKLHRLSTEDCEWKSWLELLLRPRLVLLEHTLSNEIAKYARAEDAKVSTEMPLGLKIHDINKLLSAEIRKKSAMGRRIEALRSAVGGRADLFEYKIRVVQRLCNVATVQLVVVKNFCSSLKEVKRVEQELVELYKFVTSAKQSMTRSTAHVELAAYFHRCNKLLCSPDNRVETWNSLIHPASTLVVKEMNELELESWKGVRLRTIPTFILPTSGSYDLGHYLAAKRNTCIVVGSAAHMTGALQQVYEVGHEIFVLVNQMEALDGSLLSEAPGSRLRFVTVDLKTYVKPQLILVHHSNKQVLAPEIYVYLRRCFHSSGYKELVYSETLVNELAAGYHATSASFLFCNTESSMVELEAVSCIRCSISFDRDTLAAFRPSVSFSPRTSLGNLKRKLKFIVNPGVVLVVRVGPVVGSVLQLADLKTSLTKILSSTSNAIVDVEYVNLQCSHVQEAEQKPAPHQLSHRDSKPHQLCLHDERTGKQATKYFESKLGCVTRGEVPRRLPFADCLLVEGALQLPGHPLSLLQQAQCSLDIARFERNVGEIVGCIVLTSVAAEPDVTQLVPVALQNRVVEIIHIGTGL